MSSIALITGACLILAGWSLPSWAASGGPGDLVWVGGYDGGGTDEARALVSSPDGAKVFVTGTSRNDDNLDDYGTVAHDATTGKLLWAARYDSQIVQAEPEAIAVSPDGARVFVTGHDNGAETSIDYATVAYDADSGTQLWVSRLAFPSTDHATALAVSPDSARVFVTGYSYDARGVAGIATIALEAATGDVVWFKRYFGPSNSGAAGWAVAVSPGGDTVVVAGDSSTGPANADFLTIAYESTSGRPRWVKEYTGPGNALDVANALTIDGGGTRVFVTGHSQVGLYHDFATIAYDLITGSELWVSSYDGPAGKYDVPHDIAVQPDGSSVFVFGASDGGPTFDDLTTIGYDASTGAQLWVSRAGGPGIDNAEAIAMAPDGATVYVAGTQVSPDASRADYITVAYDAATGGRVWSRRFDDRLHGIDQARDLAVGADGSKVFVTGKAPRRSEVPDFVTVAYET
jgi:TolB-like protein